MNKLFKFELTKFEKWWLFTFITGTESCGKTLLTKMLAKEYHTSWSEEIGRYYSEKYLGGNERVFTKEDFIRIGYLQHEEDLKTLHSANKVAFFDTDSIVTEYYSNLYLGEKVDLSFLTKQNDFDLILMMEPTVPWVADGLRENYDPEVRWRLHRTLLALYERAGLYDRLVAISNPSYEDRLDEAMGHVSNLIV